MTNLGPAFPQPHLLLVDDDDDGLRLLCDIVRGQYRSSVARNGDQAYQHAVALLPDLILMDVRMPRIDGFAACRLLQANPATARIPVLFLSNEVRAEQRIEGLRAGAVDYIIKPCVPEEVLARIAIHLQLAGRQPAAPVAVARREMDEAVLVQAAKDLINSRLANTPSPADIAQAVGTHEKRLTAAFREQLGQTVYGYVREQRMQRACALLRETNVSIDNVAALVGYQNAGNFSTAFRQGMGCTPSDYRDAPAASGAA